MEDPLELLKATLRKPLDTVETGSSVQDQLRRVVKRALRPGSPSTSLTRWIRAKALEIMVAEAELSKQEVDCLIEVVVAEIARRIDNEEST